MYRRAAAFVDKIFKGAKPAELPRGTADQVGVRDQPQNRQSAGIEIPKSVLFRADEVIQ